MSGSHGDMSAWWRTGIDTAVARAVSMLGDVHARVSSLHHVIDTA